MLKSFSVSYQQIYNRSRSIVALLLGFRDLRERYLPTLSITDII